MARRAKSKNADTGVYVAATLESVAAKSLESDHDPRESVGDQAAGMTEEFRRVASVADRERALQNIAALLRASTQATGAAIALSRDGEFVCVAADGSAPPTGVVIDPTSGISGACLQSGETTVCDDAAADPRVNRGAGQFIRSIIAAPVRANDRIEGLVEILSTMPYAFDLTDKHIVEDAAEVLAAGRGRQQPTSLARAASVPAVAVETPEPVFTLRESPTIPDRVSELVAGLRTRASESSRTQRVIAVAAVAVCVLIAMLWLFAGRGTDDQRAQQPVATPPAAQPEASAPADAPVTAASQPAAAPPAVITSAGSASAKSPKKKVAAEEESDDAEVTMRIPPSRAASAPAIAPPAQTAAVKEEPPALAFATNGLPKVPLTAAKSNVTLTQVSQRSGGELVHKVKPTYPALALSQRLAGQVDLIATVGVTGRVINVRVLSGPALLSQAAVQAVQQWRYSPLLLDGKPVPQELPITIQFRPLGQ